MENQSSVRLELEADEALLLFEFLAREIENENGWRLEKLTEYDGELWALNALHCLLEQTLVDPFRNDYSARLSQANEAILKRMGSWPK